MRWLPLQIEGKLPHWGLDLRPRSEYIFCNLIDFVLGNMTIGIELCIFVVPKLSY